VGPAVAAEAVAEAGVGDVGHDPTAFIRFSRFLTDLNIGMMSIILS
jgi:hypothetical protein